MDLIKYDMTNIWAVAGDVVEPDAAKIRSGWAVEVVPRQWWNWFENRQDNNIAYMLQKGIPEWDATTQYIANKSYVQRSGIIYKSTATSTGADPITLNSWVKAFVDSTAWLELIKGVPIVKSSIPAIDSGGNANYALFAATGLQVLNSATPAEARARTDTQQANSNLTGLSGVTPYVNGLPYFTSTTSMGISTFTAFGRSLVASLDAASARVVLGLGNSSTANIGTTSGTVAAGDDSRLSNALQKTNNLSDLSSNSAARSNLGLTSAATTEVTNSRFDTTVGKLLKVGDFGIGSTTGVVASNLNTLQATGVYSIDSSTTNIPSGAGLGGVVFHQTWDTNTQYQLVSFGDRIWSRSKFSSTWGSWQELYTTSNSSALAAQVQSNLQPQLDAKVGRAGDTMTGVLALPSIEVGTGSSAGLIDLHGAGPLNDYDVRFSVDNNTSATGQGRLLITAGGGMNVSGAMTVNGAATFQSGISTTTLALSTALPVSSGGTGSTTSQSALVILGALPAIGGSYSPALSGLKISGSFISGQSSQGLTMSWNDTSDGASVLTNNQGGGSGGFIFRNVNSGNTSETGRVTISQGGGVTASGPISATRVTASTSVGAGSAFMDTNGNINGSVWGGYLSNYLSSTFLTSGGLPSALASLGTGTIGSYAFLINTSGSTVNAGQNLSSGLTYASTTSNSGGGAGGTWRAMGLGSNNGTTLWLRVA